MLLKIISLIAILILKFIENTKINLLQKKLINNLNGKFEHYIFNNDNK